jgi:3-phenylpropionate/cinnamic acid dioxygenase small subunit
MPITPQDLCNIEEIKQLKASHFRFLDTKQWEKWREIFTDDATFEGTAKPYGSTDEFVAATRGVA